jgi:tetratricopeptide (TPR) repeat protein
VNRARQNFSIDPLRNASLLLTYGQDKIRSGENDAGFKALNKALEIYKRLGDEGNIAQARFLIADALLYLHSGPRPQEALSQIERALELYGAGDVTIIVCRGLSLKALAYYEMGDFVVAKEVAREGLEMAVVLNDGETEGRLLTILGMVQRDEYRLAESIASFERAMNLLVSLADSRDRLKLIYERALLSIIIGDYVDAEQLLKETIMTAATLSPLPLYRQIAYAAQGHLIFTLLVQGKPIDKEVRKHQADADIYKPQQLSNLTPLLSPAQDPKSSLKDTEAWFRSNLMSLPPASIASTIIVIVGRMISFGFMRDAARWSAAGIRYSRAKGWSGWEAAFCGYRAVITAKLGRYNAAAHWRDLANERMDKMTKQSPAWSAWASGLIARSSGDEATARQYLEESIRRFSESGNHIWAKRVAADLKDANLL